MNWRWAAGNPATKSALVKMLMKGEGRECECVYWYGPRPIGGAKRSSNSDRQACSPSPFAEIAPGALRRLSSIALSSSWAICWIKRSMRRFI